MNFKAVTLILSVCLLSVFSEVRAQSEVDFVKEEQLQLSYNFGQVKEGDTVGHTFEILNSSQFVWQVSSVMPSCECVSANLVGEKEEADDINPGEVFQIAVKADTTDYKGTLEQFVYVNIIQKNESKILKLVVEGEVIQKTPGKSLEQLLKEASLKSLSKKAAGFSLSDIDGNNVSLSDYKGKVVLLNFWTIWCPNCAKERPSLEKLYQKFKNDDFVVLAVNLRESKKAVKKFLNKHKLSFSHLLDEKDTVGRKYNVSFLPDSFIINKDGWIVAEAVGMRNWIDEPTTNLFEYLLSQ